MRISKLALVVSMCVRVCVMKDFDKVEEELVNKEAKPRTKVGAHRKKI